MAEDQVTVDVKKNAKKRPSIITTNLVEIATPEGKGGHAKQPKMKRKVLDADDRGIRVVSTNKATRNQYRWELNVIYNWLAGLVYYDQVPAEELDVFIYPTLAYETCGTSDRANRQSQAVSCSSVSDDSNLNNDDQSSLPLGTRTSTILPGSAWQASKFRTSVHGRNSSTQLDLKKMKKDPDYLEVMSELPSSSSLYDDDTAINGPNVVGGKDYGPVPSYRWRLKTLPMPPQAKKRASALTDAQMNLQVALAGGEEFLRDQLKAKAKKLFMEDAALFKGVKDRDITKLLREIDERNQPGLEAALTYYASLKSSSARAAVLHKDALATLKDGLIWRSHNRPHAITKEEAEVILGLDYYQGVQKVEFHKELKRKKRLLKARVRMLDVVQAAVDSKHVESTGSFKTTIARMNFFKSFNRTLKALRLGLAVDQQHWSTPHASDWHSAKPQNLGQEKAQDAFFLNLAKLGVTVPEPMLMRNDNKADVDFHFYAMGDKFGLALGYSLKFMDKMRTLNVSENRLTGKALSVILSECATLPITKLDISRNTMDGEAVPAMEYFLQTNVTIQDLNLSNVKLGKDPLCKVVTALIDHPSVTTINLSNNIMCKAACNSMAMVLAHPYVRQSGYTRLIATYSVTRKISSLQRHNAHEYGYDLSWNEINPEGGKLLGKAIDKNSSLTYLDISNNSIEKGGPYLANAVKHNTTLKTLSMKHNGLSGSTGMSFALALRSNNSLELLELDGNDLTEEGGRALFRAIVSGIKCQISLKGCTYQHTHELSFSYTAPHRYSPYSLDLTNPVDCAILSELCTLASRNPRCEMTKVMWSSGPPGTKKMETRRMELVYSKQDGARYGAIIDKATGRPFVMPEHGYLTVSYKYRRRIPTHSDVLTPSEMQGLLKLALGSETKHSLEHNLALASDDIYITTEQTELIIDEVIHANIYEAEMEATVNILSRIYSRIVDCENRYRFLTRRLPKDTDRQNLANRISHQIFRCNLINLTGHWRLDLSHKGHRDVLMNIAAVHAEESYNSKISSGRLDTSQKGNWTNFRNETLDLFPFELRNDNIDELPRVGILEFDYVSSARPPLAATSMTDKTFENMMKSLGAVISKRVWKPMGQFSMDELTLAVCADYVTSSQILSLIDCLSEGMSQADIVVATFSRIIDLENFDIVFKHLAPDIAKDVINRLGWLNIINPMKPAYCYDMNLRYRDHRVAAQALLNLGAADVGSECIKDDPSTEIPVMALYPALGRLAEDPINSTAVFAYAEVGERGLIPNWVVRQNYLRSFLVGTKPLAPGISEVIKKYEMLATAGKLGMGSIDSQYAAYMAEKNGGNNNSNNTGSSITSSNLKEKSGTSARRGSIGTSGDNTGRRLSMGQVFGGYTPFIRASLDSVAALDKSGEGGGGDGGSRRSSLDNTRGSRRSSMDIRARRSSLERRRSLTSSFDGLTATNAAALVMTRLESLGSSTTREEDGNETMLPDIKKYIIRGAENDSPGLDTDNGPGSRRSSIQSDFNPPIVNR